MKNIKIQVILLMCAMMMAFSSCGTEMKIAKRFVKECPQIKAAVYFPEEAQVTLVQGGDGSYSHVLDSLDQNAFLDIMYAAYADELGRYGVEVVLPENADAVVTDSTYWMVLLSKVEIQGLFTTYLDHVFDLVDDYEFPFSLNTVNVASWFDINDGEWLPTQYYEYNLTEDFESHVSLSGKEGPQYHYDITPIKADDIYNFAVFLGKRYAGYTHSCIINHLIRKEMAKKGSEPLFKVCWDPDDGSFYYLDEEEGFIELKNDN